MPGVARKPDVCTGHGCYPPRASCHGSPNVFTNSQQTERLTDPLCSHCCGPPCHGGTHVGHHNVYANSLDVQTCTDPISCGSSQAQCSSDVFVN